VLTSEQVRAARALLRWEQTDLAEASGISLPTIKRLEVQPGPLPAQRATIDSLKSALERQGIAFLGDEDGGGRGVRLRRFSRDEGLRPDQLTTENDG
jgi:hypothetical protein